jgi:hypothetical protein
VDAASIYGAEIGHNGAMLEMLVIALLLWLWVIERRFNSLADSYRTLKLDMDGMRAMRTNPTPPPEPAGLPEVTTLHTGAKTATAT